MKIVLYYHTLVSLFKTELFWCLKLIRRFSFLVLRNTIAVVCAHVTTKLQETFEVAIRRSKCEDLKESDS